MKWTGWLVTAFIGLVAILGTSNTVSADPSPGIRWLTIEPLTLLDWGIWKLGNVMEDVGETLKDGPPCVSSNCFPTGKFTGSPGGAYYDYASNEIHLLQHGFISEKEEEFSVDKCKVIWKEVRRLFLLRLGVNVWPVDSNSSKWRLELEKWMSAIFSHDGGFESLKRPKNLGRELAERTRLKLILRDDRLPGALERTSIITCLSPLLREKFVFSDKE
jgi:hypothetical protein